MSDLTITQELQTMGYQVERRTVDKYRSDILGIPNSNQRRRK
jgi:DNA-directed RNA polymerase specialized sigma54-like protein